VRLAAPDEQKRTLPQVDSLISVLLEAAGIEADSPMGKALNQRRSEVFQSEFLPSLWAFPRVKELLERMKRQGLSLAVASAAKESELRALLQICGASELVAARTSSDHAVSSKPDPDIILAALGTIRLRPEEAVYLGDTPYDVEAGTRGGVAVIGLRCGGWGVADLAGAIRGYDSPADLLENFEESPLAG
jgi:phosphoglycolate phosphatase-like HAD superfamily hydrolase